MEPPLRIPSVNYSGHEGRRRPFFAEAPVNSADGAFVSRAIDEGDRRIVVEALVDRVIRGRRLIESAGFA